MLTCGQGAGPDVDLAQATASLFMRVWNRSASCLLGSAICRSAGSEQHLHERMIQREDHRVIVDDMERCPAHRSIALRLRAADLRDDASGSRRAWAPVRYENPNTTWCVTPCSAVFFTMRLRIEESRRRRRHRGRPIRHASIGQDARRAAASGTRWRRTMGVDTQGEVDERLAAASRVCETRSRCRKGWRRSRESLGAFTGDVDTRATTAPPAGRRTSSAVWAGSGPGRVRQVSPSPGRSSSSVRRLLGTVWRRRRHRRPSMPSRPFARERQADVFRCVGSGRRHALCLYEFLLPWLNLSRGGGQYSLRNSRSKGTRRRQSDVTV